MGTLQLNPSGLSSLSVAHPSSFSNGTKRSCVAVKPSIRLFKGKTRAVSTIPEVESQADQLEPPSIDFAFVHSVLLPDGTPDVHFRTAIGGQKLRDVMLDSNIELYGPYARPLLNCGGGGTCSTCMVEVIDGKELMNPRTDKEKEKLKRKPKNWRLACQITVGQPDSRGMVVVQQLPEWKAHEWKVDKQFPSNMS